MAYVIPLIATPAQQVQTNVGGQNVLLDVRQLRYGLFMTVYKDDALVVAGVICHDRCLIIRSAYFGFSGDFMFADTQGSSDPDYTGLGDRWELVWLDPSEL